MTFPFGKYWLLILLSSIVILVSLTSVLVAQFQLLSNETSWLAISLSRFVNDWVAPLAMPLSASATLLVIISALMIIRYTRGTRRREVSERVRTWASETIKLLVSPITEESPVLQVAELKTKFQVAKTNGLKVLVESEHSDRDLHDRVWKGLSIILKYSEAFSKGDTTFDFKGELITLVEKLNDVIEHTSNK